MSNFTINKVRIKGISACVPRNVERNDQLSFFSQEEANRIIAATGVHEKRIVDDSTTPSDLCIVAAIDLMNGLAWDKVDVDCLVYVSTNRDFLQPNTSCVIHQKLGLREDCFVIDVPCGCPGWIYGLNVIGSFLQTGQMKKGLLLVGDTSTRMNYPGDKSTRPLFGDAGTATALEFDENASSIELAFLTKSSGWNEIITPAGGARNPFSLDCLNVGLTEDGYECRSIDCRVNGMNVFSFSISDPPELLKNLIAKHKIDIDCIDYFLCHQANKYIVDKIRRKIGVAKEKTPLSLDKFGNTSNASIPLTMVTRCSDGVANKNNNILALAFGTGLMCGAAYLKIEKCYNKLVEY